MGGRGSGSCYYRWETRDKKRLVEDCRSLSVNRLVREGLLRPGACAQGTYQWTYPDGRGFRINLETDTRDLLPPVMRLWYSWVWTSTRQQESADYPVWLTTTRPHFGGVRWWFICPLVVGGVPCSRRVGGLYLPPAGRYFGCRHCYGLTYRSCQEHDKRVDAIRKMDPKVLLALMKGPSPLDVTQLLLVLKALRLGLAGGIGPT